MDFDWWFDGRSKHDKFITFVDLIPYDTDNKFVESDEWTKRMHIAHADDWHTWYHLMDWKCMFTNNSDHNIRSNVW